jgi:hypothetical protein
VRSRNFNLLHAAAFRGGNKLRVQDDVTRQKAVYGRIRIVPGPEVFRHGYSDPCTWRHGCSKAKHRMFPKVD